MHFPVIFLSYFEDRSACTKDLSTLSLIFWSPLFGNIFHLPVSVTIFFLFIYKGILQLPSHYVHMTKQHIFGEEHFSEIWSDHASANIKERDKPSPKAVETFPPSLLEWLWRKLAAIKRWAYPLPRFAMTYVADVFASCPCNMAAEGGS